MNPAGSPALEDANEVSTLITTLVETGQRLEELTAGEVDAVSDGAGRTFLLQRAQEQLRHSEAAKQAAILNALPAHIALLDSEGLIVSVNDTWRRFACDDASQGPGSRVGLNYLDICNSAEGDGLVEGHKIAAGVRSVLDGAARSFSIEYACQSSAVQYCFLLTVTPLSDDHPKGAIVMYVDVTAKRETESSLRESERRFSDMLGNVELVSLMLERDARITYCNDYLLRLTGWRREEIIGRDWIELFIPPANHDEIRSLLARRLAGQGSESHHENPILTRSGEQRLIQWNNTVLRSAAGTAIGVASIGYDITHRKEAETALKESEERFRSTFEQAAAGMGYTTPEGRWVRVNQRLCDIVGYTREELLTLTHQDITHPDDHDLDTDARRKLITDELQTLSREKRYLRKGGSPVWVDVTVSTLRNESGEAKYFIAVVQDITARKELELELFHAQRMEGVGQLAGGIAHDFNNLLTVISCRSQLALERMAPRDPLRREFDLIYKTSARAAALTHQLLAFSRKQVLQPKVLDMNELVNNSTNLLKRLIGENIDLAFVPAPDAGRVRVDPGQLEQVIVNLAVNARDAMPDGGRLTIETSNVTLAAEYTALHAGVTPGPYVALTVSDTGTGMDRAVQARLFEPFFTTKGPGYGTGLGLATVYGIVKQSDGHIRVYSELGHGTVFKVYLPRTDALPEAASVAPPGGLPAGTETVLLVEDENEVRHLAHEVLGVLGYTVLEAASPGEAILIAERHVGLIGLLLTDVVMPGMSGRALASRILAERPETKVLFMSGYTDDAIVRHGVLEPGTSFLEKPFTVEALAVKVRKELDRPE
jgi:two-component system, cell cycle sensor histidine kinase and response regulator CckA